MTNARVPPLLRPRPPVNLYPPILDMEARRLHLFLLWQSEEALKTVKQAGLEVPSPEWRRRHDQNYG